MFSVVELWLRRTSNEFVTIEMNICQNDLLSISFFCCCCFAFDSDWNWIVRNAVFGSINFLIKILNGCLFPLFYYLFFGNDCITKRWSLVTAHMANGKGQFFGWKSLDPIATLTEQTVRLEDTFHQNSTTTKNTRNSIPVSIIKSEFWFFFIFVSRHDLLKLSKSIFLLFSFAALQIVWLMRGGKQRHFESNDQQH